MAYVNPDSLFEDEDVSDENFVNRYTRRSKKKIPPHVFAKLYTNEGHRDTRQRQLQDTLQRQKEIEQKTLDSTEHSLALLQESEVTGIRIAEELYHQGEQLQNINQNLNRINANLNESKKHLNGMTSILHGFKNYISRKMDKTFHRSNSSPNEIAKPNRKNLNVIIDNKSLNHNNDFFKSSPTMRLRNVEAPKSAPVIKNRTANEMIDANLDKMAQHITRLKDLGHAIGEEIEQQTDMIDTVQDKAEVANIKLSIQNRQMDKFLGK